MPRQCCLATTVRFAPSCTDTKCARKYCEYEKRTHPWYLTCNAKASYFQRPLQSIVKIKISKLLTALSIPAWIIYSETNVFFFFGIFILLITWAIIEKRLFSCWSSTSQHFSLPSVLCQEIIAKLLITYPQQAMWMMMAVSKVNIRRLFWCVFSFVVYPLPQFWLRLLAGSGCFSHKIFGQIFSMKV